LRRLGAAGTPDRADAGIPQSFLALAFHFGTQPAPGLAGLTRLGSAARKTRQEMGVHASVGRTPAAMWPDKLRSRLEISSLLAGRREPCGLLALTMIKDSLTSSFLRYAKPIGWQNGSGMSARRVNCPAARGGSEGKLKASALVARPGSCSCPCLGQA